MRRNCVAKIYALCYKRITPSIKKMQRFTIKSCVAYHLSFITHSPLPHNSQSEDTG